MTTRSLRDYQLEAVESVEKAWAKGMMRPAIVLPTGTGKTDCIARIATAAARDGLRVLAVAHRSELLDQITARCKMHAPDIAVGRVQASRNESRRPITTAMAPTLANESRRRRLPKPDVLIIDEAHHAASPSYMKILGWAGSFEHTRTMGVTATMTRGDRRGLGDVWQDVVYSKDIRWAVDSGWLVPPRGRAVVVKHLNLASAKVSRGDYQDNELGEMVSQDVDQIVKAWLQHASERPTVAFVPTVASAQALADEFRAAGVTVGEVYGTTPHTERAMIYKGLAAGEIRVLVNVMVATEGFDCPPLSCILMARPTRLPGLYTQIVGRGLRPSPGKDDCLVLDVVGASRHQKLVTLIDLHETAEYDSAEIDTLPCEECGGARPGTPLSGEVPYACTCIERAGPGESLLNPGGAVEYVDVDLFETSRLNWLFTHGGVRFLPCGARMALLWPEEDGTFTPGHCTVRGKDTDGRWVGQDGHWHPDGATDLRQARVLAEQWALAVDPSVAERHAPWRKRGGPASPKQVEFAESLGILGAERMGKSQLSDEISIHFASKVLDR